MQPRPSSTGRGAGGTVCHPSHTPGGCGHMVLSQEGREITTPRKVRIPDNSPLPLHTLLLFPRPFTSHSEPEEISPNPSYTVTTLPHNRPSTEPEKISPNPCYTVTTHSHNPEGTDATPLAIYEVIDEMSP